MVKVFEDKFSVSKEMIEEYLGCSSEAFSENDFVRLRKVYGSLRDGMAKREDYFNIKTAEKSVFESSVKETEKPEENKQQDIDEGSQLDGGTE